MHPSHLAIIALEIAHERVREAEAAYRFHDALRPSRAPGIARRSAARAAALVSRSFASLARRLDAVAFDPRHGTAH